MNRYIKKKQLDPLETYVPSVLQARLQLETAGRVMSKLMSSDLGNMMTSLLCIVLPRLSAPVSPSHSFTCKRQQGLRHDDDKT